MNIQVPRCVCSFMLTGKHTKDCPLFSSQQKKCCGLCNWGGSGGTPCSTCLCHSPLSDLDSPEGWKHDPNTKPLNEARERAFQAISLSVRGEIFTVFEDEVMSALDTYAAELLESVAKEVEDVNGAWTGIWEKTFKPHVLRIIRSHKPNV